MRPRRLAFFVLVGASIASCGKDYGTDPSPEGGTDGGDELASPPPPPPGDAAPDARCTSAHGPPLVDRGAFCIDSTEVTNQQYDEFRLAVGKDAGEVPAGCEGIQLSNASNSDTIPDHPAGGITWCSAFAYCAWAGKRLCGKIGGGRFPPSLADQPSVSEILFACGNGDASYPYGATYVPGACNDTHYDSGTDAGLVAVGSLPGCAREGVFDLAGNVAEWTYACLDTDGGAPPKCLTFGDSFGAAQASCETTELRSAASSTSDVGFRCCADLR